MKSQSVDSKINKANYADNSNVNLITIATVKIGNNNEQI